MGSATAAVSPDAQLGGGGRRWSWRERLWIFMDEPHSGCASHAFSMVVLVLIFVSTATFVLETVQEIRTNAGAALDIIETVCIAVFTLEVLLRLISTPSCKGFFTDGFNWVDIISIVPFYVERAIPETAAGSLGVIRVVRLVRVARIVKVSRYSQSIRIFSAAMLSSMRPLIMLVFLVSIAMVMFSSAVYFAELTSDGCRAGGWSDIGGALSTLGVISCDPRHPDWTQLSPNGTFRYSGSGLSTVLQCACTDPNPFTSIPATFWWCIVTMTTVGFGDEVPVTLGGRIVAVVTMVCGIIILALPITVIGTNFSRVLREIQQERMLDELNRIDKDGDGLVDEEELALMIQHMAAVAGDLPKELIPDAKSLLRKYDEDGTGALTQEEVQRLRSDMHALLGTSEAAAGSGADGASVDGKTSDDGAADRPGRALPHHDGWPPGEGELRQRLSAGEEDPEAGLEGLGPSARAVVSRLEDIEDRVDDKLVAIIDLLRRMNAAVATASGGDTVV